MRAAVKNVARAYGGRDVLAMVMGVPAETLSGIRTRRPSGTFAIRLAQAAGMSVEALLTGKLADVTRCGTCGHRAGTGRAS